MSRRGMSPTQIATAPDVTPVQTADAVEPSASRPRMRERMLLFGDDPNVETASGERAHSTQGSLRDTLIFKDVQREYEANPMLFLIQTLLKYLHHSWRSMGRSSYRSLLTVLLASYVVLSIELLVEFVRSWIHRSIDTHDEMRRVQSWNPLPRSRLSPAPASGPKEPPVEPGAVPPAGTAPRPKLKKALEAHSVRRRLKPRHAEPA